MNLFTFRTTTHPTTPAGIGRSNVMPTTKRRALILISSGRQLPLVEPAEVKSISTGFFLVEMAQVLKEFENDYEFTFATPDGNAPPLVRRQQLPASPPRPGRPPRAGSPAAGAARGPDPGLRTTAQQRAGARRVPPRTDPPPRQAARGHLPLAAGTRPAPPR